MEVIKKMRNKFLKSKSFLPINVTHPHLLINGTSTTIDGILNCLIKQHLIKQSAKSRVALINNFSQFSDINIAFAYVRKNEIRMSDGLSQLLQRKSLTKRYWSGLVDVHLQNKEFNSRIKALFTLDKQTPIFLLLVNDQNVFTLFTNMLEELNKWSSDNHPLTIGVDQFGQLADVTAIELLSSILSTNHLKYIFHHRGTNYMDFLNISESHLTTHQTNMEEFPKEYNEDPNRKGLINSMLQLRKLLQQHDTNNSESFRNVLFQISGMEIDISSELIKEVAAKDINVYDNELRTFLIPTTSKYRIGFCLTGGGSYVPFNRQANTFSTKEKYVLVSRDNKIMLNRELLEKINKIDPDDCTFAKMRCVDGVPGSGKTHSILQQYVPGKDLILTQTKAGLEVIRAAIKQSHSILRDNILYTDLTTVSSFIVNGPHKKFNRVFIDEPLHMHAGFVGYISKLSQANEVILVGDSRRKSAASMTWHDASLHMESHTDNTITRRCPMDVCYILSDFYKNIHTTNRISRSIQPTFSNGEFQSLEKGTLILTFTGEEKCIIRERLRKYIGSFEYTILTIDEAQSLSNRNVVLVRIDTRPLAIYNSIQHIIAALSRHTHSFRYITIGEMDLMFSITNKIQQVKEESIIIKHVDHLSCKISE